MAMQQNFLYVWKKKFSNMHTRNWQTTVKAVATCFWWRDCLSVVALIEFPETASRARSQLLCLLNQCCCSSTILSLLSSSWCVTRRPMLENSIRATSLTFPCVQQEQLRLVIHLVCAKTRPATNRLPFHSQWRRIIRCLLCCGWAQLLLILSDVLGSAVS